MRKWPILIIFVIILASFTSLSMVKTNSSYSDSSEKVFHFNRKISAELENILYSQKVSDNGKISVILVTKRGLSASEYNELANICEIVANTSKVFAIRVFKNDITRIASLPFTLYLDSGLKTAEPHLMDTSITTRTNYAYYVKDASNQNVTGKGVKIGIIDTGIDWRHPFFYYADGPNCTIINGTHVELPNGTLCNYYFIDVVNVTPAAQGAPSGDLVTLVPDGIFNLGYEYLYIDLDGDNSPDVNPDNPEKVEYGILLDFDGNGAPSPGDNITMLRTPKIKKVLDQRSSPYTVYISGVNLSQFNPVDSSGWGHGAHVAGIILGGHTLMKLHGVAPDAEIYVVANGGYFTYENVIYGMTWLAQENVSVINMSFGGTIGYLDGSDPWDIAINDLFKQGIVAIVSAGNDGNKNQHIEVEVPALSNVNLTFNTHDLNIYLNILWREPWSNLEFYLISPYGNKYDLGSFTNPLSIDISGVNISCTSSMSPRYTCQFLISIYNLTPLDGAIWTLKICNPTDKVQKINGYLLWSTSNTWNPPYISKEHTINSPATADSAIAVGALTKDGWLTSYSSIGPRIDEVNKPEICAPGGHYDLGYDNPYILSVDGDVSLAGQPPYTHGHGYYTYMCGTSMAAPHITGFVALLLQDNPNLSPTEIRELLFLSTGYTHFLPHTVYPMPDDTVGYGGFGYINIPQLQTGGINGPGTVYVTSWYPSGFSIAYNNWLSGSRGIIIDGDDSDWLIYYPVIVHNDSRWYEESSFKLYSWHENESHIFFYMKFRVNHVPICMINVFIGRDRPGFMGAVDYYLPEWKLSYNTSSGVSQLELWNNQTNQYGVMPAGGFFGVSTGFSSIDGNWLIEFYVRKDYIEMQSLSEAVIYFAVYDINYAVLFNNNDLYDRPGASFYASIDQTPVASYVNTTYVSNSHGMHVDVVTSLNDYWGNVSRVLLMSYSPSGTSSIIYMEYNSNTDLWEASYSITPENQSIGEFKNILIIYDELGAKTTINAPPTVMYTLIDNVAPLISLEIPMYATGTVQINWTVDEENLKNLTLYIDSDKYDVLGTNIFTWDTTQYGDGNHIIRLYAQDAGGLESEVIGNVIVDNTPPAIIIISPINNTRISEDSIEVTWQAFDNVKVDHFDIYLDEVLIMQNVSASQRSATITELSQGTHVLKIKVYDEVGKYSEATLIFTYKPPTIMYIVAAAIFIIGCAVAVILIKRRKTT